MPMRAESSIPAMRDGWERQTAESVWRQGVGMLRSAMLRLSLRVRSSRNWAYSTFRPEPRMEASMHNGKRALLAVVTAGVLLTTVALAMLAAASSRVPGPSLAQIDTFELMVQARDLPDQTIENPF
jgi:hypothetical protein